MSGEILSLKEIVQLVGSFGVSGLVVLLWWLGDKSSQAQMERSEREHRATLERMDTLIVQNQRETQAMLMQFQDWMKRLERMYENNVELVKAWQRVAEVQESTIAGTVTAMTRVEAKIEGNRFCPVVREKWSVQEG